MKTEVERLRKLASVAQVGWWEAEFSAGRYVCSEYLSDLLQLNGNSISFEDFRQLVREDYRDRIVQEFNASIHEEFYESTFPIISKYGETWIRTRLSGRETVPGRGLVSFGMVQLVEANTSEKYSSMKKVNDLILRQNSISKSLLRFVNEDNLDVCIMSVLQDLLEFYSGGRTYIFEYDGDYTSQSCTYEVVAEGIEPEKDTLQNVPVSLLPWWTGRLMKGKPIVLDSLDQLPSSARPEYEILKRQNIKSILVCPLRSGELTWGYIGIDLVVDFRNWMDEDFQWFSSLANIIGLCIDLRKSKDKAIQEHSYLQNLFRYMPMGYFKVCLVRDQMGRTIDYRITDSNEIGPELTGRSPQDFIGRLASELYPNHRAQLTNLLESLQENNHFKSEIFFEKTGRTAHCITYTPEPDTVVTLLLDSTEMVQAHRALDHSEKLLKSIFANIPVGVEIYDREGCLIDLNTRDMEIFGVVQKEDVLGVNFFDNPNVSHAIKNDVRLHDTAEFRMQYSFVTAQKYYNPARNDSIELYTKVSKIYDAQGNFNGYILINIDNTERILAANRIREFEDLFLLISDNAKVGYIKYNWLTKEGYAIPQWFKNFGETVDTPLTEVLGIYGHLHPDDAAKMIEFHRQAECGGEQKFQNEVRVRCADTASGWKWLRTNIVVTQYEPESGIIEMIGINYDITELKETEAMLIEAKEKAEMMDRLKSSFIANMSHEIRTPLNAIVGFSGLLSETDDREERMQYVKIIRDNNALLLQLITDILNLSKMESGALEVKMEKINLASLLDEIINTLRTKAVAGVELVPQPDPQVHVIESDYYRLKQLLLNLVGNALKFTSHGTVKAGYRLGEDHVEFFVSDTGIGIPQEQLSRIFERFVKLNDFIPGTGLGLSISKNIVEELGGEIGVTSEVGKGSQFTFSLPFDPQINPPGDSED